jgi:hypothetical protein
MVPEARDLSTGSCVFRFDIPRGDGVGNAGVVRRRAAGMPGIGQPANGLFSGRPLASPLPGKLGGGRLWTRPVVVVNEARRGRVDVIVTSVGKSLA